MAKFITRDYQSSKENAVQALLSSVQHLGYSIQYVEKELGIVVFESGMSGWTWFGSNMSTQVISLDDEHVRIKIGGTGKDGGMRVKVGYAQLPVGNQGDVKSVARKVFRELDKTLGESSVVASGSCFIATAVYGSYDDPSVLILRAFRDQVLYQSIGGRMVVRLYYLVGPIIAASIKGRPVLRRFARKTIDKLILCINK